MPKWVWQITNCMAAFLIDFYAIELRRDSMRDAAGRYP
jgi:hypothetical protein